MAAFKCPTCKKVIKHVVLTLRIPADIDQGGNVVIPSLPGITKMAELAANEEAVECPQCGEVISNGLEFVVCDPKSGRLHEDKHPAK